MKAVPTMLLLSLAALIAFLAVSGGLMLFVVGVSLPKPHTVTREETFAAPPAEVYRVITDYKAYPSWRTGIQAVELRRPVDGKPRFRETSEDGDSVTYAIEDVVENKHLETRVVDDGLPWGGTWTYELTPEGNGTRLAIREDGVVHNPIYRVLSRYVFGHSATIDQYLKDLGAKVGK